MIDCHVRHLIGPSPNCNAIRGTLAMAQWGGDAVLGRNAWDFATLWYRKSAVKPPSVVVGRQERTARVVSTLVAPTTLLYKLDKIDSGWLSAADRALWLGTCDVFAGFGDPEFWRLPGHRDRFVPAVARCARVHLGFSADKEREEARPVWRGRRAAGSRALKPDLPFRATALKGVRLWPNSVSAAVRAGESAGMPLRPVPFLAVLKANGVSVVGRGIALALASPTPGALYDRLMPITDSGGAVTAVAACTLVDLRASFPNVPPLMRGVAACNTGRPSVQCGPAAFRKAA